MRDAVGDDFGGNPGVGEDWDGAEEVDCPVGDNELSAPSRQGRGTWPRMRGKKIVG